MPRPLLPSRALTRVATAVVALSGALFVGAGGAAATSPSASSPSATILSATNSPAAVVPANTGANATATTAFHPVAPTRLLDTRHAQSLRAGDTVPVVAAGAGGIPAGIVAVVVNVTATDTGGPGFVTVYPSGAPRPPTSVLNAEAAGQTLANLTTVPVGNDGSVGIFASMPTDIVVDVFGYYAPAGAATAGRFVAVAPRRAIDTRTGRTPLAPGAIAHVPFDAILPADASAVVANLTVTEAKAPGYWTAWPAGGPRPLTSNLNSTAAGQTVANQIIVPVGAGAIDVYSQSGGHVLVDVTGYFTGAGAPSSGAGLYVPVTPTRVLDTRTADLNPIGNAAQPQPGWTVEAAINGYAAVTANVTLVHSLRAGYVTAYPAGTPRPDASSVSASRPDQTIANQVITALGSRGLALYAQAGGDLLVDVAGYYTGAALPSTLAPEGNPTPPPPDRIVIPSAGVDISVGYGVDPATLADGPGYWPDYGKVGQPGNVLIGAHRTSHGGPFEHIDLIRPGDDIWVYAGGLRYHYVASEHFIVNYDQAGPVVRQTAAHELTLFACHPPGSETQRYIVRALEVRD
jgi:LPXTG-site transpeptidase (sortase) family protein